MAWAMKRSHCPGMRRRGRSRRGYHSRVGRLTCTRRTLGPRRGWRVILAAARNLADRFPKGLLRREYVFQTWIRQLDAGAIRASAPSARRASRCRRNLTLTHALHGISRHRNGRARIRSGHAVRHSVCYLLPVRALTILASYLRVRRATERRTAPLVRRSPFDALPPMLIGAFVGCFLGVLAIVAIRPIPSRLDRGRRFDAHPRVDRVAHRGQPGRDVRRRSRSSNTPSTNACGSAARAERWRSRALPPWFSSAGR